MPRELRAGATDCRSFGGHRFGPAEAPCRHKRYGLLRSVRRRKRPNGFVRTARRGGEASSIRAARCVPQATAKRHQSHTRDRFLRPANMRRGRPTRTAGSERFGNRPPRRARPRTVPMAGRRSAPDCRAGRRKAAGRPARRALLSACCRRRTERRPTRRSPVAARGSPRGRRTENRTPTTRVRPAPKAASVPRRPVPWPVRRREGRPNGKQTVRPVDTASGRPPCDRDPAPGSPPEGKHAEPLGTADGRFLPSMVRFLSSYFSSYYLP